MNKLIVAIASVAPQGKVVVPMNFLLVATACCFASSSALGFEVTEAALNQYVEQGLAKRGNRDPQFLSPKVSLLDGYATICAKVRTTVFPRDVDFCADMTPMWRQETGSLLASKMAMTTLNAPGVSEKDIGLAKVILNQIILPGLDGIEVYKADNFIGKQISWVKVLPGKLEMGF